MLASTFHPLKPCNRSPEPSESQVAGVPSGQSSCRPEAWWVSVRSTSDHEQDEVETSGRSPSQQTYFHTAPTLTCRSPYWMTPHRSIAPSSTQPKPGAHSPGSQSPSPSPQGPHSVDAQYSPES